MFSNRNIHHPLQTSGDAPRKANRSTEFPGLCHTSKTCAPQNWNMEKNFFDR